jgi:hypothetical protein
MENVKILEIKSTYDGTKIFTPPLRIIAAVYGVEINFICHTVTRGLLQDLQWYGYKTDEDIKNIIKEEALDYFNKNIKLVRKTKLNKIYVN